MAIKEEVVQADSKDRKDSSNSRSSSNNNHGKGHQNTVFIHKLYNILQDDDLKDLIWWSDDEISFHIKPNEKFSKALATYFKHTNITSFVRQLNIYGFHKVNNIIDTSVLEHTNYNTPINNNSTTNSSGVEEKAAESNKNIEPIKIWEFRHSANLFRKGDTESLKLIKRRSSSKNISSLNNNSSSRKNSNHNNSTHGSATSLSDYRNIPRQGSNNSQSMINNNNTNNNNIIGSGRLTPSALQQQIIENGEGRSRFTSTQSDPLPSFYPIHQSQLLSGNGSPTSMNVMNPQFRSTDSLQALAARNSYNGADPHSNTRSNSNSFKNEDLVEQLRATNLDMVKLIDLIEKSVAVSSKLSSVSNDSNSISGSRSSSNNNTLNEHDMIQNDILNLRQDILNRWNDNINIYQGDAQMNQYLTSNNAVILQAQQAQQSISQQQQPSQQQVAQQIVPVIYRQAPMAVPQQIIGYNTYAQVQVNQPQGPQMIQTSQPIAIATYPTNQGFTNDNMMNTFEIKNHSRNDATYTKRNMSVLVDPLTPATSTNTPTATATNTNFIPPVVRPIPIPKTMMQRGSSVSSVSIASVIDSHRRTPESLLRESITMSSNGTLVSSNNSVSRSAVPRNISALGNINEELSDKSASRTNSNQYAPQQIITPQSSISMGKNEKGYVDLQNNNAVNSAITSSTSAVAGDDSKGVTQQDYKVSSILNDTNNDHNGNDEHINKKIKTSN